MLAKQEWIPHPPKREPMIAVEQYRMTVLDHIDTVFSIGWALLLPVAVLFGMIVSFF